MKLQAQFAQMMDNITCTASPPEIHQWYNDILASNEYGSKHPWGANMEVPDASSNCISVVYVGMKKSVLMGMHGHGFCCKKGKNGEYMCCLVFM
jgi:hypothetical protein